MAKLQMEKIEIVSSLRNAKSIIEDLQRQGVVELIDENGEDFFKFNTTSEVARFERKYNMAQNALDILKKYTSKKPSVMDNLKGRKAISKNEFLREAQNNDKAMDICYQILEYAKRIDDIERDIAKWKASISEYLPYESLSLPCNFEGTKTTFSFIGKFPYCIFQSQIDETIKKENASLIFHTDIIMAKKDATYVVITTIREHKSDVLTVISDMGFTFAEPSEKNPREKISRLNESISNGIKEINDLKEKIISFYPSIFAIEFVMDYFSIKIDKYKAISKLCATEKTIVISGYIPKKYSKKLIEDMKKKYPVAICTESPKENDDVPVEVSNSKFSSPVEGIARMYAMPSKDDIDPVPVMAFFYYLFFGMMLSDAGYGLIMVIATTFILKKFPIEGSLKQNLKLFQYCGISTLIWGALFGSWFGDLPQIIAKNFFGKEIETTAIWFEPLDKPIKLLLFSFALGIAHLFWGLGVRFWILWKNGKKSDALWDVLPIYLTVLGVAPLGASVLTTVNPLFLDIGKYMALLGVVLIVLTAKRSGKNIFVRIFGGVYGLYNTATGYLSDILSYSRLLALGLATGSIASVINLIATMPESKILKLIMLVTVGIVGHGACLGVNLLGAYVHADRLQFVELFSKFYSGGGRRFQPFKINTKYIKFEKENIYE